MPPVTPIAPLPSDKYEAPPILNKIRKLPYVIILVQFIIIVALTAYTLHQMTSGQLRVTIQNPTTTTVGSNDGDTDTDTGNGAVDEEETTGSVVVDTYMIAYDVVDVSTLPTGASLIPDSNKDYLYPLKVPVQGEREVSLELALKLLFGLKVGMPEREDLESAWSTPGVEVTNVKLKSLLDGATQVDVVGELVPSDAEQIFYMKAQLEKVIEIYTQDYLITFNGSELEYQNFGAE